MNELLLELARNKMKNFENLLRIFFLKFKFDVQGVDSLDIDG